MGEKLLAFFQDAQNLGGNKAVMRLTVLAGISSVRAKDLPDDPDNIKKFEDAINEIKKEYGG